MSSATPQDPRRTVPLAAAPRPTDQRISAVDTLRGFALLGILPVNIVAFALPMAAYFTPMNEAVNRYRGPFRGVDAAAWLVTHFTCDLKMMTIFSMLFGAGLVLMGERAEGRPSREGDRRPHFAVVYYRRIAVLALLGLFHGFVIWYGDILFYYALAGLVLYPLRRTRPGLLVAMGLALLVVQVGLNRWEGSGVARTRAKALQVESAADRASEPTPAEQDDDQAQSAADRESELTPAEQEAEDAWESIEQDLDPSPAQVAGEIANARGSPASTMRRNLEYIEYNLTSFELVFWLTRALGCMLVGMGLMKLSVFSAQRSFAFYGALVGAGYGVGLPIVAVGVWQLTRHHFEPVYLELVGRQFNFVGSVLVALGHVGLVMSLCKKGWMQGLARRLAAVGRMALTNYLAQSIVAMAIFSGWGLGEFARLTQAQLWLVVGVIWAAQLGWSAWWLARFRYGPAEWLWRSATYGRWQPMTAGPAGAPRSSKPCDSRGFRAAGGRGPGRAATGSPGSRAAR
jgi:uncharacterized protein